MSPITRAQLVNQKDLTVDELAALADMIMLSQASVQSVPAEVNADRHNAEVLTLRQRTSASASPTPAKEKKKVRVKQKICQFHQKWGREAKSCRKPCLLAGKWVLGGHQGLGASSRDPASPLATSPPRGTIWLVPAEPGSTVMGPG